jgi:hypothetical protein
MKKVRIILLSIIVLSIAGGVFAFKASLRRNGSVSMCTTDPVNGACPPPFACATGFTLKKFVNINEMGHGNLKCYSILSTDNCAAGCTLLSRVAEEGD